MGINNYLNKKAQYAQVMRGTSSACCPPIYKRYKDDEKCRPIFGNKSNLTKLAFFPSPSWTATGAPGSGDYSTGTQGWKNDENQRRLAKEEDSRIALIRQKIANKQPLTPEEIQFIYQHDLNSLKPVQADADQGSKLIDESLRKVYPEIVAISQSNLSAEQKQKKISELLRPVAISAVHIDDPAVYEKFIPLLDRYGISLKEVLTDNVNSDDSFRDILESGYFGKGKVPIDRLRHVLNERKSNYPYVVSERDMLKGVLMDPNGIQNLPFYFSQFNDPIIPGDSKTIFRQQFGRLKAELWHALPQWHKENFERIYGKPFDTLTVGDVQYVLNDLQSDGVPLLEGVDINTPTQSPLRSRGGVPAISNSTDAKTGRTIPLRSEDGKLVVKPISSSNGFTFVDLGNGRVALYDTEAGTFVKASEYPDHVGLFGDINPNNRLLKDSYWGPLVGHSRKGIYKRKYEGPFGTGNSFAYMADKQNGGTPFADIDSSDHIPTFPALTDENGNIITDVSAYLEYFTLARLSAQRKAATRGYWRNLIPEKNMYGQPTIDQDSQIDKLETFEQEAWDEEDYFSEKVRAAYIEDWKTSRQQKEQELIQSGQYNRQQVDAYLQIFDDIKRVKSPLDCDIRDATVVSEGMLIDSKGNVTEYPCCYIVRNNKTGQLRTYIPPVIRYEINQLSAQNDVPSIVRLREISNSLDIHAVDILTYEALTTPPEERTGVQQVYISEAYKTNPEKLMRMVTQSYHEAMQGDPNYNLSDAQRQLTSKYIKKDEVGNVAYSDQLLQDALSTQINLPQYSGLHDLNDSGIARAKEYIDEQGQLQSQPDNLLDYNYWALNNYYQSQADYYAYGQAAALMHDPRLLQHPLFAFTGPYRLYGSQVGIPEGMEWPMHFSGDAAYDTAVNTPTMAYQIFLNSANMATAGGDSSDYNSMGSETTKDWNLLPRTVAGIGNIIPSFFDNIALKPGGMSNTGLQEYNPGDFVYNKDFTDLYNLYNTGNTDGGTFLTRLGDSMEGGIDLLSLMYMGSAARSGFSAKALGASTPNAIRYAITGSPYLSGIHSLAGKRMLLGNPQAIFPVTGLNGNLTVGNALTSLYNGAILANTGDIGALYNFPGKGIWGGVINAGVDAGMYFPMWAQDKAYLKGILKGVNKLGDIHDSYQKLTTNVPNWWYTHTNNGNDTEDTSPISQTDYEPEYDTKTPDPQNTQDKPFPWQQLLLGTGLAAGGLGLYNLMKDKNKKKKKKKKKNIYDHYEDIQNSYDQY